MSLFTLLTFPFPAITGLIRTGGLLSGYAQYDETSRNKKKSRFELIQVLQLFVGDEEDYVPGAHTEPRGYEALIKGHHPLRPHCLHAAVNRALVQFRGRCRHSATIH